MTLKDLPREWKTPETPEEIEYHRIRRLKFLFLLIVALPSILGFFWSNFVPRPLFDVVRIHQPKVRHVEMSDSDPDLDKLRPKVDEGGITEATGKALEKFLERERKRKKKRAG